MTATKKKPRSYGMAQANARGISRVAKDAEEDGVVFLAKGENVVAAVVPLTLMGWFHFSKWMGEVMNSTDPANAEVRVLMKQFFGQYAGATGAGQESFMKEMMGTWKEGDPVLASNRPGGGKKNRTEDRATLGSDPSAVSMEGKGRRRKAGGPPNKQNPPGSR
jgi:hypothetical protein